MRFDLLFYFSPHQGTHHVGSPRYRDYRFEQEEL